jgi:hypothetical protein
MIRLNGSTQISMVLAIIQAEIMPTNVWEQMWLEKLKPPVIMAVPPTKGIAIEMGF